MGRGEGLEERDLLELAHHRDSDAFSELEKLALDYALALTETPADVSDELFEKLRLHLDEAQLMELTATAAWENYLARFNRGFAVEKESGRLDGLRLCPVDRSVIYWGKLAGSFAFMLAVAFVITPVFLALFNLPLWLPRLGLVIILAVAGFAAVGTLFAAVAVNTRARDMMLPILFLPVVVPVIVAAVRATAPVLAGRGWAEMMPWLQILIAFDIIYLVAATLVFEFVLEE